MSSVFRAVWARGDAGTSVRAARTTNNTTTRSRMWRSPSASVALDECLDHLASLVGLRSRFRDPLVLAVVEHVKLHVAAGGLVRGDELLLHCRTDVVVERTLHDEQRHKRHRLV